mmetsp:Transcript_4852/g.30967  ORF Transcript_4852/g.30967 Transcript_4852/m.30967 type:complete len:171 (-) Transcript_4852:2386-2898(-)
MATGKQNPSNWGSSMRQVITFATVEEFWGVYNNIVPPSRLGHGTDFHLFKEGIKPEWEDPACAQGGKWTINVPKSGGGKAILDTWWLHTMLALIGEQFNETDEICGAVLSVRNRQDRVAVWTKTASNEAAQLSIGRQIKQVLDVGDNTQIGYLTFQDAKNEKRPKDVYTV